VSRWSRRRPIRPRSAGGRKTEHRQSGAVGGRPFRMLKGGSKNSAAETMNSCTGQCAGVHLCKAGAQKQASGHRQKTPARPAKQGRNCGVLPTKGRHKHRRSDRCYRKAARWRCSPSGFAAIGQDQVDPEEPGIHQHQHNRADNGEVAVGKQPQGDHGCLSVISR